LVMVNRIMAKKEKAGHRQRLRERFLEGGLEECSDEMLLELLLIFAIGRKDVKPLAQELVKIFGSLEQVLSAPPDELYKVKGLGQTSITLLKVVNFIKSGTISAETDLSLTKCGDANQLKLFEDPLTVPNLQSNEFL
jgi:DNA repair protein RadC